MTIIELISKELQIPNNIIGNVISLFNEGATIPFIARYRKEKTNSLDEVAIEDISHLKLRFEELEKRKVSILKSIEQQGKLTPALKAKITQCYDPNILEDLYLPYKRKVKSRGTKAKDAGLEPLAKFIMGRQDEDPNKQAQRFINKSIKDIETALSGAIDIIAEWISEYAWVRKSLRSSYEKYAVISSKVKKNEHPDAQKYRDYFDFSERIIKCPSHRLLAILRAENEKILRIKISPDPIQLQEYLKEKLVNGYGKNAELVEEAIKDSYKRLLHPSLETQTKKLYKEKADTEAIRVFNQNLEQLLLAAPLGEKRIMGIDPGFRTGCKVACIDEYGNLTHHTTIYPHAPQRDQENSTKTILSLVKKYSIEAIAVGNGTAGRETISFLESISYDNTPQLFLVNEDGASIYSASKLAREEFPDLDLTVRGAVSIARRLMDPLAELVKIDPKSIGVGQYQHDVNQQNLKLSLDTKVMSCVNRIGINLNTATKHILTYISGVGPTLATNIVSYRTDNGPFNSRKELMKVPKLGAKAYEQAAGFLRIKNGKNLLDNTSVHPEQYPLILKMTKDNKMDMESFIHDQELRKSLNLKEYISEAVGMPTLVDIMKELDKPGIDPRGKAKNIEFDKSIRSMEDLRIGQCLKGLVTNVTNFGAFVNIGIKNDGLVHISQISHTFVAHPNEVLKVNQEVNVKVIEIDIERKRIQLSIKDA